MPISDLVESTKEQLRLRRLQSRASDLGYKEFNPELDWPNVCAFSTSEARDAYARGWRRALKDYNENRDTEKCPYCNSNMEHRASINWCTNVLYCGYHIHDTEE